METYETEEINLEKKLIISRTVKKILLNRKAKTKRKQKLEYFFTGSQISNKNGKLKNKEKKDKTIGHDDQKFSALFKNYLNIKNDFENRFDRSLLDYSTNVSQRNNFLFRENKSSPTLNKIRDFRLSIKR